VPLTLFSAGDAFLDCCRDAGFTGVISQNAVSGPWDPDSSYHPFLHSAVLVPPPAPPSSPRTLCSSPTIDPPCRLSRATLPAATCVSSSRLFLQFN